MVFFLDNTKLRYSPPFYSNGPEETPLHYACLNGYLPIVEYLISKGANIEAKDQYEGAPLHCACSWIHLQIVQYLI